MDFYNLFPNIEGWVQGLPHVFPVSLLKETVWGFAVIEAFHLLSLGLLGGCVIMLNLRLMGVGLTELSPSSLEQKLRPLLWLGVGGVLLSGVVIGMLNPEKLYTSPAFFAKMIAMVSALIFSFGVSNAVAKHEGGVTQGAMIAAGIAFLLWLWSIGVFSLSTGTNPGTFHMITAGYAILLVFSRQLTRMIALGVVALLVLAYVIYGYLVLGGPFNDYDAFMGTAKLLVQLGAVALVGLLGYEIFTGHARESTPLARLIALFSILSWVTVAAAGRWIGLS
ncbi:MAG: DUF6644 family protein [Hyphomonadaceae bacterium]